MKVTNRLDINAAPAWTESVWREPSLFDEAFGADGSQQGFVGTGVTTPAVNIVETDEDLRVEMVAPGMKKEAFKVTVQSDILTISYDHEDNREGDRKKWKYRIREFNYHSFMRSFELPDTVEVDRIRANYSDGILSLTIPKKKEAIARRIQVS